jgi:hypothetical protein
VTDFGAPVLGTATTPKELVTVGSAVQAGTVAGTITFGQSDPNGGTWAALYDGSTGRITFSRITFGAIVSMSVWAKTTSTDATTSYAGSPAQVIFGDTTGGVMFQSGIHDGKWEVRRHNGSVWQTVTHPTAVNDGDWHHLAFSYNAGACLLYVDGVLHTGSISSGTTGGVNALGCGFGTADFFDGSLYLPTFYHQFIWKPHPIS